jgi:hypothetical protein
VLYQPLTVPGWIALIAATLITGVVVALLTVPGFGLLGAALAFYVATAIIRVWEHRQIRRAMADSERTARRSPRE